MLGSSSTTSRRASLICAARWPFLDERGGQRLGRPSPDDLHLDPRARLEAPQDGAQLGRPQDLLAGDLGDPVAELDTGGLRRPAGHHVDHLGAAAVVDRVAAAHAQVPHRAGDLTGPQAVEDRLGLVDRDGEADVLAALAGDRGVDADDLATVVHQRAARSCRG